jgi:RNA polymerase sigma-70 factor (ECF subfamily)
VELYDTLRVPVFRYLVCLGVTAEEAQEITQESFLRAFQHLQVCRDRETNLQAWVFRVAHNLAANQRKKNRRMWRKTGRTSADLVDIVMDQAPNAEERLLEKEKHIRLRSAMASLSVQQLQCISLRGEGLRYREIAHIMELSISTVAETLYRAFNQLKSY